MDNKAFWQEKIDVGGIQVPRLMAAPLDGITDSPFRQMIRKFSPDVLLFTEMRHVAYVANEKNDRTVKYNPLERPIGFQFSANKKDYIAQAVEKVIAHGFTLINLNCGCPSRNVIKSGSGAALMGDIPRFKELLEHFMSVIDGRIPMTVKIRAGFKEKNAVSFSQVAASLGATCIIVHPRTQPEMSNAPVDYDIVKKIKEKVKVPIIFSGEITDYPTMQQTYERTGVDGFMIGRALWGIPWKIKEIYEHAQGNEFHLDLKTSLECMLEHFKLCINHYGPSGYKMFKKQLPLYIHGVSKAKYWREKLLRSTSAEEMQKLLQEFYDSSIKVDNNGNK